MTRPKASLLLSVALGLAAVGARPARAQSYGDHDQVLTVGAVEFRGTLGASGLIGDDGYLSNATPGAFSYYDAPLRLPEGALIEQICEYVNDSDPAGFEYVETYLVAVKLVPGGGSPLKVMVSAVPQILSTGDIGYGYYCTDNFQFTLLSHVDLDGDSFPDDVVYSVEAYVPYPSQNAMSLGGVRITWKRQVAPPPATPTFGDVPASDGAWSSIEALAASGITSGCGGGNYCPDATLTRRQMAVFLAKALGLHWVD